MRMEKTSDSQEATMKHGMKCNCTEGQSGNYSVHMSRAKMELLPKQFASKGCAKLFGLIRLKELI